MEESVTNIALNKNRKNVASLLAQSKIVTIFALAFEKQSNNNFSGCSAVRLAHLLWEQGVVGSNPATPTKVKKDCKKSKKDSGCSAVRLAHLLWEQGVVGSNPATPTNIQAIE